MFIAQGVKGNAAAKVALKSGVEVTLATGTGNTFVALIPTVGNQITSFRDWNTLVVIASKFEIFLALSANTGNLITTIATIIHKVTILEVEKSQLIKENL